MKRIFGVLTLVLALAGGTLAAAGSDPCCDKTGTCCPKESAKICPLSDKPVSTACLSAE
jgi:hypothetical protein